MSPFNSRSHSIEHIGTLLNAQEYTLKKTLPKTLDQFNDTVAELRKGVASLKELRKQKLFDRLEDH